MLRKADKEKIDRTIKELWLKDIKRDYSHNHLLKEDTLKNSFYYHLRRKLGTKFIEERSLRIFTEYREDVFAETGKIADIVIVQLNNSRGDYLKDQIKSTLAVIELKFGGENTSDDWYYSDIAKVKEFVRYWNIDCLFYLGFISEKVYSSPYWLDKRQMNNWAKDKLVVMSANYNADGVMEFHIQSCNGLNRDMDS
jgi:hypothetical protein